MGRGDCKDEGFPLCDQQRLRCILPDRLLFTTATCTVVCKIFSSALRRNAVASPNLIQLKARSGDVKKKKAVSEAKARNAEELWNVSRITLG